VTTLRCGPVVVIDDHDLLSSSLVLMLLRKGFEARRVHTASRAGILAEVGAAECGVALVDLDLGVDGEQRSMSGVDLIAPLRSRGWRPVVMSGSGREEDIAAGVVAGAVGVVRKSCSAESLMATVRTVLDGGGLLDPEEQARYEALADLASTRRQVSTAMLGRLTRRELQVLERLADGCRAAAVAEEFVTSISTVRSQIRSILSKLGVGSQLEAVALLHSVVDR